MDYDLIVRGGTVLSPDGEQVADVGIGDGRIRAVAPSLSGTAREELDATGLHVLPGGTDMHVHCDEPGREHWEGFATATAALAAGGMTSFADMPLNSTPALVDVETFDLKLAAATANARIDFALWGGLVPGNLGQMEPLHRRGVIGFKAFMSETGMADFRPADDHTLLEGMRRAAELDVLIAVHAENDTLVRARADEAERQGRTDARAYLDSRPAVAELEAIGRAIAFAADTGCRLHLVHVSTAEGVELVEAARAHGVDVSWETATHFLALTDEDVVRLGVIAKCAPVPRDADNRQQLWRHVATCDHAIVASDHSPCAPELRETDDFFAAWGGITGCQSTLGTLLQGVGEGRLELAAATAAVTSNVASRLRLAGKGAVAVGHDADLSIVDLDDSWLLESRELRYRHPVSALVGTRLRGRVRRTLSRGRAVIADGKLVDDVRGQLIRPRTSEVAACSS